MTTQEQDLSNHQTGVRVGFIILQTLNLFTLIPWFMGVNVLNMFLYGMNVDVSSGEAAYELIPYSVVVSIWLYPILSIVAFIAAIILFRRGKRRQAMICTAAPIAIIMIASCSIIGFILTF